MEEYQFQGRVEAGVKKTCQRCHAEKFYMDFDIRRRPAQSDGRMLVSISGKCTECIREQSRKIQKDKYEPTGGKSGRQKKHKHIGPDKDSIEYKFFFT